MSLNFAPYSEPPPLPRWNQSSASPSASTSYQSGAPVSALSDGQSFSGGHVDGGVSGLETTLQFDLGYLAALAYAFGPFGAVFLLVTEINNDFVRFHAYQSAMLSAAFIVFDFLTWFIIGSRALSWLLVLAEAAALVLLSLRAYRDTDLLDRYHVPLIGRLAEEWVAEE